MPCCAERAPDRRRPARGFTLIELMITVVVVAILGAVALPTAIDQIRKSRRADAITSLNKIAQAQERWRANNAAYSANLAASGINVPNPSSGYYTLAVASATATGYVATATAAGAQLSDARCRTLTMTVANGETAYTAATSGGAANNNLCWNR